MKTLNKKQADNNFISFILPLIKKSEGNLIDKPMRCEEYNSYIDSLQKSGEITESQANRYCIPKHLLK